MLSIPISDALPLDASAIAAINAVAAGYSNLEYDLLAGSRGSRGAYLERCLALLCEAQAATVVNNCAAALVLLLRHFTAGKKREVVISRGELIQIGGGFRIPEILEASGAALREVGTTNRTTLDDYASALGEDTALILKVHRSNFYMSGFVEEPAMEELAQLAARAAVPLIEDLGSGAIFDTVRITGLEREPTPAEVLKRGADLVCFSGDKLFGGPQAGIIAGKAALVQNVKRDPLFRALRCDKLVFAALQSTAELHLADSTALPAHALLCAGVHELRARAESLVEALAGCPFSIAIAEVEAEVGGGTLPRSRIPSIALAITPEHGSVAFLVARLRAGSPPVIGYIFRDRLHLDLRTVFNHQDRQLLAALHGAGKTP